MNGIDDRYLLDTNSLIYYFNGDPIVQSLFNEIITHAATGFYSPITWIELLCYPNITELEANQIRTVLQRSLTRVPLTEAVLDSAAEIRRSNRTALPDAVIAACAIESRSTLITRNTKDFNQIANLSLIDPVTTR